MRTQRRTLAPEEAKPLQQVEELRQPLSSASAVDQESSKFDRQLGHGHFHLEGVTRALRDADLPQEQLEHGWRARQTEERQVAAHGHPPDEVGESST